MYWATFAAVADTPALRGLLEGLSAHPDARLSIAPAGALAARVDAETLRRLHERIASGQVEWLAAPMGHVVLPLLPAREIRRQISAGIAAWQDALGVVQRGLVPPELAYSHMVGEIAAELGIQYLVVDELARTRPHDGLPETRCYDIEGLRLSVFFRQRHPRADGWLREGYIVTDAPPVWDRTSCRLGDLLHLFPRRAPVHLLPSSAGTTPRDLLEGAPYSRWDDPRNEIHRLGWQLARLVMSAAERAERLDPLRGESEALRRTLDLALDACMWDAASCRPRWDPARVVACAEKLAGAARMGAPVVGEAVARQAEGLARRIGELLRRWEETGEAKRRIARHHGDESKREAS